MFWFRTLFLAVLASSAVALPAAQERGAITGQAVNESDGAAESDVMIYVKRSGPEPERRVANGPDGRFRIAGLPDGEYQVLLLPGYRPVVREHVIVSGAEVDLGTIAMPNIRISCECSYRIPDPSRARIVVRLGDQAGNRLLRSWLTLESSDWGYRRVAELEPRNFCLCSDEESLLGKQYTFEDLLPGTYTLRGYAAGYQPWVRPQILVETGKTTEVAATWLAEAAAARQVSASEVRDLRPGEQLARIETLAGEVRLAIDASRPSSAAFLRAVDRHAFDGTSVEKLSVGLDSVFVLEHGNTIPFGFSLAIDSMSRSAAPAMILKAGAGDTSEVVGRVIAGAREFSAAAQVELRGPERIPLPVLAISRVRASGTSPTPGN